MVVFFDLDGTLMDTAMDIHIAFNLLCKEYGKEQVAYEVLEKDISFGLKKILGENLQITGDMPDFNRAKNRYLDLYKDTGYKNSKLFPGVRKLLTDLSKCKLRWGIVTNRHYGLSKELLQKEGIFEQVECLVAGDMVANPKPSPEPLLKACDMMQVAPKQCLFIGDAKQDIIAGNAAGMTTMTALFGYVGDINSAKKWPAHYTAGHIPEILPQINKWLATNTAAS